jgi:hypothetical protein
VDDPVAKRKVCGSADACPGIECSAVGGNCTEPGRACCAGFACVASESPVFAGCRERCDTDDACATGCCVAFENQDGGFCADASACGCAAADGTCGGVQRCCAGLTCTTFDATGAFVCKPSCSGDSDCASDCCVAIRGTSDSACLPPEWCGR